MPHAGIDPMPGKMNFDLKLLYCEFQKFEAVVGSQPKKKLPSTSSKATKHIKRTFLISDYYQFHKGVDSNKHYQ